MFIRPKEDWAGMIVAVTVIGLVFSAISMICMPKAAHAAEGIATFYTTESCQREGTSGIWTASGERFNEKAMTCALPVRFGKEYMVTNVDNGKSVVVRHNDTGPGKGPRHKSVIIDLTPAAFKALGGRIKNGRHGKIRVGVQEIRG